MPTPTIKDIRTAAAARQRRRQLRHRWLVGGIIVVTALVVAVVFVLPGIIKSQVITRTETLLQRSVEVEKISLNPMSMQVALEGLRVPDRDGGEFLAGRKLTVDLNLWSTLQGNVGLNEIVFEGFTGRLVVDQEGHLNIADILGSASDPDIAGKTWDLRRLEVIDSSLAWQDESDGRAFSTTLGPLSFSLEDFHSQRNPDSPYRFEAMTESGEAIRWDGTISVSPFQSSGRFEVAGLTLPKYEAYTEGVVPLAMRSGVVNAAGNYEVRRVGDHLQYELVDGSFAFGELELAAVDDSSGRQFLNTLELRGVNWTSVSREMSADQVTLQGGVIELSQTDEGLHWLGVELAGEHSSADLPSASMDRGLRQFLLHRVSGQDLEVRINLDQNVEGRGFGLSLNALELRGVDLLDLSNRLELEATGALLSGGGVSLSGSVGFAPFAPQFQIKVEEFTLLPFASLLEHRTGYDLVDGLGSLTGSITTRQGQVALAGTGIFQGINIMDSTGDEFVAAEEVQWSGLDWGFDSASLRVDAVNLVGADIHLKRSAEGGFNAHPQASPSVGSSVAFESQSNPIWEFGRIALEDGEIQFVDESSPLPVLLKFSEVTGSIQGWHSERSDLGSVNLRGSVSDSGTIQLGGEWNPLADYSPTNLELKVSDLEVRKLSGYLVRYLGYEVREGKLAMDVDWRSSRTGLDGEIRAQVTDFGLGAEVASPDATLLPVPMAVKLLQNRDGQIEFSVPIAGEAGSPEFGVGQAMGRAVRGVIKRAVTAPFSQIGAGDSDTIQGDLDRYEFSLGSEELTTEARSKLKILGDWLLDRPGVSLTLSGGAELAADEEILRPTVLESQLRQYASPAQFDPVIGWRPHAREAALVTLFQVVFGEPPLDPSGVLPPPSVAEGPPSPASALESGPIEEVENRSLLAWLAAVFNPRSTGDGEDSAPPATPEVSAGEFPVPEGLQVELPALPVEEITRRLLLEMPVDEALIRSLARCRAEAVRDHLIAHGVSSDRLEILEPSNAEPLVTLTLR